MTHLTYLEAAVVGLIQGVTELFPISSLGHNVLLPALVGGSWEADLNVASSESPYLAFVVGLHVATAIALLIYFWRDWVRIVRGFFSSIGQLVRPAAGTSRWQLQSADERLAWLIVVATIPVGLVGLVFEHEFRVLFGKPIRAAIFLVINGLILLAGEFFRRKASVRADQEIAHERELVAVGSGRRTGTARHAAGHQAEREAEYEQGDPVGPAAVDAGLPVGPYHRHGADPGAAGRHQPGRGRDGGGHVPRAVPRGRRPVRLPARHPGHPGRRRAQGARPHGPAGQRHPGPDPGRQRPVRRRRLPVGPLPGQVLPHPDTDPVRDLLHRGRPRQHRLPERGPVADPAHSPPRARRPRSRIRSLPSSTALRSRTADGVTSTHSPSAQNSSACSRLSTRAGTSRSSSSPVDWRMLVSLRSRVMLTSMSSAREFSPTIIPS